MAQLKLMLLLLHAGHVYGLPVAGMRVSFECDTDFVFTINCSLNLTSAQDGPHWLTFEKKYANGAYECMLSNASGGRRSCSVSTAATTPEDSSPVKTFVDYDLFRISLCGEKRSDGADRGCQMLDDSYKPAAHIKPNAPCCLAVSHNSSRRHFTWNNTYEKLLFSTLKENLKYQLCFYKRWDRHGVRVRYIDTDNREYSVADSDLEMDTEYCTKVRSAPAAAPFQGKWSDWSQEVHWRTDWANDAPVDGFLSKNAKKVSLASGVTATLVLILCCASLIRWRQGAFVPTPAPYFQSLYGECHGDFKSWVDTPANMTFTLKPEETLQVDSHEEESPARDHQAGLEYKNTNQPVRKASPARSIASSVGLPPSEEKAQCGPSGVPLIQREAPHEYCTLSVSQQPEPTTGKVTSVAVKHTGRSEYDSCNTLNTHGKDASKKLI